MERTKTTKWLSRIVIGLCLIFFYLPIIIMMVFSFNSSRSLTHFEGFSFQWYEQLFNNRDVIASVWTSVSIATLSTIISTIVGTLSAIGLSKSKEILREVVLTINDLPILNPEIVTAIGLMLLFVVMRFKLGYLTMLLAHITFSIPYVILAVMPRLRTLDPNLTEAALDLGATPFQALTKVILPQISPSILAASLIAFTMSFDDFVISYFVTGNGVKNISIMVYTMSKRINPTINALSTILVLVITAIIVLVNVVQIVKLKGKTNEKNILS